MRRLLVSIVAAFGLVLSLAACVPGVPEGTTCYSVEINLGPGPGFNQICRAPGATAPPEYVWACTLGPNETFTCEFS